MVEKLNLDLSLQRTLHDLKETNFIDRSFAAEILNREPESLKAELREELESDEGYQPSPATPFLVPKSGGLVRNGRHLTIKDRTVYNACVGALQPDIYEALEWSQGSVDLGYQMTENHELKEWFEGTPYDYWKQFRLDSLEKLEESDWLVEADIASYYDNIHIETLAADLERLDLDEEVRRLLKSCLQKWSISGSSPVFGKGVPQAYNASHIMAKLYLNSFDKHLRDSEFDHLRYNDDIRVFCESKREARDVLKKIMAFLSQRGLSLQSAKSRICSSEEGRESINAAQRIIEPIKERLREENMVHIEAGGRYDDIFVDVPREEINSEAIREAVRNHLFDEEAEFDSTVFHFLLYRLDDDMAVDYCLSLLREKPEETRHILQYLGRIGVNQKITDSIAEYVDSDLSVYDYQLYQIYKWFLDPDTAHDPDDRLTSAARDFALSSESDFYLSNVAKRYLGEYGTQGDMESLMQHYDVCHPREQILVLLSLKGVVKSKRNGFYADASNDGWPHEVAVSLIKSKH
jgi:retron-type reverse transcriptase